MVVRDSKGDLFKERQLKSHKKNYKRRKSMIIKKELEEVEEEENPFYSPLCKTYKKKFRKFLFENEIEQVLEACNHTRFPLRNQTLILVTYMHAFRAAEVCNLKWNNIDFTNNVMTTIAQKGGVDSLQPLWKRERELLIKLNEERKYFIPFNSSCREDETYVFTSSRWGAKFEPDNFNRLCEKLGKIAGFDFKFTPHMLRHARGTFLANNNVHILKIKALLRHARLSSTEFYTHLAANRFNGINETSLFN